MAGILSKIFGGKKKSKGNILIVDDEPGILQILSLHLDKLGYNPVGVEAAESALAQIKNAKKRFRLFIIDIMLIGENGINLARKIRKNKDTAKIPIVLMSGSFAPSQLNRIREEIPNCETLTKPFKADNVKEVITKCLRGDSVRIKQ